MSWATTHRFLSLFVVLAALATVSQASARPVHGFYARVSHGWLVWVPPVGGEATAGQGSTIQIGYEPLQTDVFTLGIGGHLMFGLNNGIAAEDGGSGIVQGDFGSLVAGGGIRYSLHPDPEGRFALSGTVGVGMFTSPSLREVGSFETGQLQSSPGFTTFFSGGFHCYTPLEHLGFGIDVTEYVVIGTGVGSAFATLVALNMEVTL